MDTWKEGSYTTPSSTSSLSTSSEPCAQMAEEYGKLGLELWFLNYERLQISFDYHTYGKRRWWFDKTRKKHEKILESYPHKAKIVYKNMAQKAYRFQQNCCGLLPAFEVLAVTPEDASQALIGGGKTDWSP